MNAPSPRQSFAPPHLFICNDCGREEHRPDTALPEGWDLLTMGGTPCVRCPDCNERIEQDHIAQQASPPVPSAPPPAPARGCSIFLERQAAGHFAIALSPSGATILRLPLRFLLTAEQARATASDLLAYAALADAPGTLHAGLGGAK